MAYSESRDEETSKIVEQLYHAWSTNASHHVFAKIRDEILASRGFVDVQLLTLSSVAKIACPKEFIEDDPRWTTCFALASVCAVNEGEEPHPNTQSRKRRKRTDNSANRLRHLALVAALWSPDVVEYYGWSSAGNAQINLMRTCALRWPRFIDDFCPRLNSVLLERHCEALRDSRVQGLNEAPLQPLRDFSIAALETAVVDQALIKPWVQDNGGAIIVGNDGRLLRQLRPYHFRSYLLRQDRYGMLISRDASFAPLSSQPEAILPTPSLSLATADATACSMPSDHNVLDSNALSVSQNPLHRTNLFADIGNTYNTCSPGENTFASHGDWILWNTQVTSTFNPSRREHWRADQVNHMQQVSRPSPPPLTLDPAILTVSHQQSFGGPVHDLLHPQRPLTSEALSRERSPLLTGDVASVSDRGSSQQQHHTAQLPYVLPAPQELLSNKRTALLVCSAPTRRQGSLAIEEVLHNKHRASILAYIERITRESDCADSSHRRKLRAKWLTASTALASLFSPDAAGHPTGRAQSHEECDLLYLRSDEAILAASQNKIFDKPIVIKESFSDSGMQTVESFVSLLTDSFPSAAVDVTSLNQDQSSQISIRELIQRAGLNRPSTCYGLYASRLRNLTKAHRPSSTMSPRFRLLETLIERAQGGIPNRSSRSFLSEVSSSTKFNDFGTTGGFCGPHLNALSGLWVRILDGISLWTIVPESAFDAAEWEAFSKLGKRWVPQRDIKLVILERDDVLFIPPASRIVYTIHSLTANVIEGGIFWDDLSVIATLQAIASIGPHRIAADELLAHQLPSIIDELTALVRSQTDRFCGSLARAEFRETFEGIVAELKRWGCQCGSHGCLDGCSCRSEGRLCTTWCSAHEDIDVLPCIGEI